MIAACSPADRNFEETLNTLQYANRAKNIQNTSRKNVTNPQHLVKELRAQLEELQAKLLAGVSPLDLVPSQEDEALNEEIRTLEGEKAALAQKFDRERYLGLAKNGIMQFKINYYRKQKNKADAELTPLVSEVEAIRAKVEERTAQAALLENDAAALRARIAEADKLEKTTITKLKDIHTFSFILPFFISPPYSLFLRSKLS